MKKALIIMGLISLITSCCSKICPKKADFFTIPATPYYGNQLRLDGCFYQKWNDNGIQSFCKVLFLYNNGVVFNCSGSGHLTDLDKFLVEIRDDDFYSTHKTSWGVFFIENDHIIFERFFGSELGYLVYREEGNIVNDTTFIMTEVSRMKQGVKTEIRPIEWTYHFKAFSPKPDSTNSFIP